MPLPAPLAEELVRRQAHNPPQDRSCWTRDREHLESTNREPDTLNLFGDRRFQKKPPPMRPPPQRGVGSGHLEPWQSTLSTRLWTGWTCFPNRFDMGPKTLTDAGCGNGGIPQLTASPGLLVTLGPLLPDAIGR